MSSEAPTSLAQSIADQLRTQIFDGKYGPGERLPSERELAARMGANRGSVREAFKRLQEAGIISVRRGGGARVVPMEDASLSVFQHMLQTRQPLDPALVSQWLDVVELVMAGSARLAIERASDAEIERALQLLQTLSKRGLSDDAYFETMDALSQLIAVASRNVVLRMVRNSLTVQMQNRHADRVRLRPRRKALLPLVETIEAAVRARKPERLEEAVRALLRDRRKAALELMKPASTPNTPNK